MYTLTSISAWILRLAITSFLLQQLTSFLLKSHVSIDTRVASAVPLLCVFIVIYYLRLISPPLVRSIRAKSPDILSWKIRNKRVHIICWACFLFLMPDILLSCFQISSISNVRSLLISSDAQRFLPVQLMNLLSSVYIAYATFIILFCKKKSSGGFLTPLLLVGVFSISLLNAARGEIISLLAMYILSRSDRKYTKLAKFVLAALFTSILALSLYTIFIQKRAAGITALSKVILFYLSYYAYPLHLTQSIHHVFGDVSPLYAVFGYFYDVVASFLLGSQGLTRYMSLMTTVSPVGLDVFGFSHDHANVLYPQFGFLYIYGGYWLEILFYIATTFLIIYISARRRLIPVLFYLCYLIYFDGLRLHPFLVPWPIIKLFVLLLICLNSVERASEASSHGS